MNCDLLLAVANQRQVESHSREHLIKQKIVYDPLNKIIFKFVFILEK